MKRKASIERKLKRAKQVEDGAYDGRFKTRVVPSKRQKERQQRQKIHLSDVCED